MFNLFIFMTRKGQKSVTLPEGLYNAVARYVELTGKYKTPTEFIRVSTILRLQNSLDEELIKPAFVRFLESDDRVMLDEDKKKKLRELIEEVDKFTKEVSLPKL
jgi:Arc/MetJ-type ribon-helix-helix transcriptional regulator